MVSTGAANKPVDNNKQTAPILRTISFPCDLRRMQNVVLWLVVLLNAEHTPCPLRFLLCEKNLKTQLQPELQHPRTATAQARIGLRYIRRLGDHARCAGRRIDRPIRVDARHNRIAGQREIRVIEDVEELSAELHRHALRDFRRLQEREVNLPES